MNELGFAAAMHDVWNGFRQPCRKDHDYTRLGPFRFDRAQYEEALRELG